MGHVSRGFCYYAYELHQTLPGIFAATGEVSLFSMGESRYRARQLGRFRSLRIDGIALIGPRVVPPRQNLNFLPGSWLPTPETAKAFPIQ